MATTITGFSDITPEYLATAFDLLDPGLFTLPESVNRDYEDVISNNGDAVTVPVVPDMSGKVTDYTPGETITPSDVVQDTFEVRLTESKKFVFDLTQAHLSLTPLKLLETYIQPGLEELMLTVNSFIYTKMLGFQHFIDATGGIDDDDIVDARTSLTNRKARAAGRRMIMNPTDYGTLLKLDTFKNAYQSSDAGTAQQTGVLGTKWGFGFAENHGFDKYTPADLVGAVNNAAGYAAGASTMIIDALNDDAAVIRVGDVFKVTGETGTPFHTVTGTVLTGGDTTSISFYPPLVSAVVDDAAVTFTPTRSALAFSPNAFALAARPYAALPMGNGVVSEVINYRGIPFLVQMKATDNFTLRVMICTLYGGSIVSQNRGIRILTV